MIETSTTSNTTPTDLLPTSCHVCGRPEVEHLHPSGDSRRGFGQTGHVFWSNADALAETTEHDRRVVAAGGPVYSSGARTAEADYVAQHVPEAGVR